MCAKLAARPNKQRWASWMMGVFLSRLLVFMGATTEVVSHCWMCFLSICVSVFLTCVLFCACAGVRNVCTGEYFMQSRSQCLGTQLPWTTTRYIQEGGNGKATSMRKESCGIPNFAGRESQSVKTVSKNMIIDFFNVFSHWFGSSVWWMFFPFSIWEACFMHRKYFKIQTHSRFNPFGNI